ncbi:MAG: hypothetical protein H7330_07300 [Hymenobacteraceae bacterium]|nr:hypothetical protein [Hymenobacteraceae bacterium]
MELTYDIPRHVEFVFRHLADMEHFVAVHPVIYRVEALGGDRYVMHEKLPFWLAPAFRYPATVEPDPAAGRIRMRASVLRLVHFTLDFQLSAVGPHTRVDETIEIRSVLPVKRLMKYILQRLHGQLFHNIGRAAGKA